MTAPTSYCVCLIGRHSLKVLSNVEMRERGAFEMLKTSVFGLLLAAGLSGPATAEIVTYQMTGEVTSQAFGTNRPDTIDSQMFYDYGVDSYTATFSFDRSAAPMVGPVSVNEPNTKGTYSFYSYQSFEVQIGDAVFVGLPGTGTPDGIYVRDDWARSSGTSTTTYDEFSINDLVDRPFKFGEYSYHRDFMLLLWHNFDESENSGTGLPTADQINSGFPSLFGRIAFNYADDERALELHLLKGTVTDITSTLVPEPATWGLMILSFAGLGWAARRRRRFALDKPGLAGPSLHPSAGPPLRGAAPVVPRWRNW